MKLFSLICSFPTYGCETVEFSASDMRTCNIAINVAIRKIYSYQRWESVRDFRQSSGFPSVYDIFSRRSEAFLTGNLQSTNQVIVQLTTLLLSERMENEQLPF